MDIQELAFANTIIGMGAVYLMLAIASGYYTFVGFRRAWKQNTVHKGLLSFIIICMISGIITIAASVANGIDLTKNIWWMLSVLPIQVAWAEVLFRLRQDNWSWAWWMIPVVSSGPLMWVLFVSRILIHRRQQKQVVAYNGNPNVDLNGDFHNRNMW